MKHDVPQSISQGNNGADASQSSRMEKVTNLPYRSCRKDEAEPHSWTAYRGKLYGEQGK